MNKIGDATDKLTMAIRLGLPLHDQFRIAMDMMITIGQESVCLMRQSQELNARLAKIVALGEEHAASLKKSRGKKS